MPAWAADRFEATFNSALADQVAAQPDLLFQLLAMLSPRTLQAAGVPVVRLTQARGGRVRVLVCSCSCLVPP